MTDWPAILRAMAILRERGLAEHEARLTTLLHAGRVLDMCRASAVLGDRLRDILAGLIAGQSAGATHPTTTATQWEDIAAFRTARRALASAAWDALLTRDGNAEQSTTAYEAWSARLAKERAALSAVPALAAQPTLHALLDAALDTARCRVLVLGNFKRGKSTLINALLGARLLPARMTPATAVLCTLRHAPALHIRVSFTDGRPPATLSLPELEDYVCLPDPSVVSVGDEEGAARRFRPEVAGVEIGLPWSLLRAGVEVVDSPGLNESGDRGSRTLAALDDADLIVYVLSATEALAADERETIAERLWERGHRTILFAVNYVNRVDEEDLPPVRERLADGLSLFTPPGASPALHFLGARPALLAHLRGDADALVASGVPALHEALAALTGPGRAVPLRRARLRSLCNALTVVEDECVGAVVQAVAALARQEEDHRLLAARLTVLERSRAAAERSDRLRRETEEVRQAEARRARAAVLSSVERAIDQQGLDESLTWLLTEMPRWLTDRILADAAQHDLPLPAPTTTGMPSATATGAAFPLPNWDGSPAMLLVAMPRGAVMRDRAAMLAHYHAEAQRILAPPAADNTTAGPPTASPREDRELGAARRAMVGAERAMAALLGQTRQALADAAALEALILKLQGALLQDGY